VVAAKTQSVETAVDNLHLAGEAASMIMAHPFCSTSIEFYMNCADLAASASRLINGTGFLSQDEINENVRGEMYNVGNVQTFTADPALGKLLATSVGLAAFEGRVDPLADPQNCLMKYEGSLCLQHYHDQKTGVAALSVVFGNSLAGNSRRRWSWGGFAGATISGGLGGAAGGALTGALGSLSYLHPFCAFVHRCKC
jgi:hypothetical protein